MTTEPDPAPLPVSWLRDAADIAATSPTQTWSNPELAPVHLVVRFRHTVTDFRRAIYAQALRQLCFMDVVMLVLCGLLVGFTLALASSQQVPGAHHPVLLPFIITTLIPVFVAPLAITASGMAVAYTLAPLVERFGKPVAYRISQEGVRV